MYISFARPVVYLPLVYSSPIKPIAFAVRSDSERNPIRLRPPSGQIAFGIRSDCVRCPTVIPEPVYCTNGLKK